LGMTARHIGTHAVIGEKGHWDIIGIRGCGR